MGPLAPPAITRLKSHYALAFISIDRHTKYIVLTLAVPRGFGVTLCTKGDEIHRPRRSKFVAEHRFHVYLPEIGFSLIA